MNFFLLWSLFSVLPATCSAVYWIIIYPNFLSPYRSFPHPAGKWHWFMGNIGEVQKEQPGMAHLKWIEEHPDASWIRYRGFFGMERIIPVSPAALQSIFMTHSYSFVKPLRTRQRLELILGDGLLGAEGESHIRQRRLLNPAFSFGHVKGLIPVFLEKSFLLSNFISKQIDNNTKGSNEATTNDGNSATENDLAPVVLEAGESLIRVDHPIHATTLDIIFKAGFGTEFNALENGDDPLVQAYRTVFTAPENIDNWMRIEFLLGEVFGPGTFPTKRSREIAKSRKIVEDFCYSLIEEKHQKQKIASTFGQKASETDRDLLNLMIEEGKEPEIKTAVKKTIPAKKGNSNSKAGLTDKEIISNMMTCKLAYSFYVLVTY